MKPVKDYTSCKYFLGLVNGKPRFDWNGVKDAYIDLKQTGLNDKQISLKLSINYGSLAFHLNRWRTLAKNLDPKDNQNGWTILRNTDIATLKENKSKGIVEGMSAVSTPPQRKPRTDRPALEQAVLDAHALVAKAMGTGKGSKVDSDKLTLAKALIGPDLKRMQAQAEEVSSVYATMADGELAERVFESACHLLGEAETVDRMKGFLEARGWSVSRLDDVA